MSSPVVAIVARVTTPGAAAFQLRKGEEGLSVFDPGEVDPPLTEDEILDAFRPGSVVVYVAADRIADLGLALVSSEGAPSLPVRLRAAHREIRPGLGMPRPAFKAALKLLEE